MKLRRLELVILSLTLAFAFFMGGFFTGRSRSAVSISATTVQASESGGAQVSVTAQAQIETQAQETQSAQAASLGEQPVGGEPAQTQAQGQTPQSPDFDAGQAGTGAPLVSDGKININTATQGELTDLPGIGSTLASRIIDYRTQNGSFARIEDIRNVSGIGERRFEAIMDLIKVG